MSHCVDGFVLSVKDMMDPKSLPFDGTGMFWGGFETIVEI